MWEADQNRSKREFQEAYKLCTRALTQDHYDYLCKNFINEEVMRICTQALSTPNAFTQIDLSAQSNYAIILASERGIEGVGEAAEAMTEWATRGAAIGETEEAAAGTA